MKQILIFISVTIALISNKAACAQGNYTDEIYPVTVRQQLTPASSAATLKQAVLTACRMKRDSDIRLKDISQVTFFKTVLVKAMGRVQVFLVKYGDSLPADYDRDGFLFVDNRAHHYFLITLSELKPVKVKASDHAYFLAGIYKRRGYGVFKIFNWSGKALTNIFQSPDFVSNSSLDCITYRHDDLKFENTDRNADGYLDLYFHGIANYYCNGGENSGRLDRKPRRSKPIAFTYYFDPIKKTWSKK